MAGVGESVVSLTAGTGQPDIGTPRQRAPTSKVVAASTIGTVIEWYDFFVNASAAALVFGPLFFPASDATVSTLAALSVYALGYVARPLGGIVFGHFGDRVGRKSMLVLSMLLMGFGTFLVGLLPTYQQIGILAPVLLIVLRLLQAMGLGGEWGGAVLLVSESAPAERRGLFGSLVQVGNPIGRLTATGVFALVTQLPEDDFLSWGWRVPFLASALLIVVGLVIRFQIDETPEFQKLRQTKKTAKMPVIEALTKYRRETVIAIGLKITEVAWVGILTVFAVTYLTQQLGMQRSVVLTAITLAGLIEVLVMPLAGWLSDVIGRRIIYLVGHVRHLVGLPDFLVVRNPRPDRRDGGYRGRYLPLPGRRLRPARSKSFATRAAGPSRRASASGARSRTTLRRSDRSGIA